MDKRDEEQRKANAHPCRYRRIHAASAPSERPILQLTASRNFLDHFEERAFDTVPHWQLPANHHACDPGLLDGCISFAAKYSNSHPLPLLAFSSRQRPVKFFLFSPSLEFPAAMENAVLQHHTLRIDSPAETQVIVQRICRDFAVRRVSLDRMVQSIDLPLCSSSLTSNFVTRPLY